MDEADLRLELERLAQACQGEHPYTLALRLQVLTGRVVTGQQVKRILQLLDTDRA